MLHASARNDRRWNASGLLARFAVPALLAAAWNGLPTGGAAGYVDPSDDPCASGWRYGYEIDVSTGTTKGLKDVVSTIDPDWRVLDTPDGLSTTYSVKPAPTWADPGPNANWINPYGFQTYPKVLGYDPGNNDPTVPAYTWGYVLQFEVVPAHVERVQVVFTWDADDTSTFILASWTGSGPSNHVPLKSGVALGPGPGAATFNTVAIDEHYWLQATVRNVADYSGLLVQGRAIVHCKSTPPDYCANAGPVAPLEVVGVRHELATGVAASGAPLSAGDQDPHWYVDASPDGVAPRAYSLQRHPSWFNHPDATWINPYGDRTWSSTYGNNRGDAPVGDYVYETGFLVNTRTVTSVIFQFGWWADNSATVELVRTSGITTLLDQGGGYGAPGRFVSFTDPGPVSPEYVLRITVENVGGFTGLLVSGFAVAVCAPTLGDDDFPDPTRLELTASEAGTACGRPATVTTIATPAGTLYVEGRSDSPPIGGVQSGGGVWVYLESNGRRGLQRGGANPILGDYDRDSCRDGGEPDTVLF